MGSSIELAAALSLHLHRIRNGGLPRILPLAPFLLPTKTDCPFQDERESSRERCRGMYAKTAMGGNIDPYINIIFEPIVGDQPLIVSLIIFAWSDVLDVGIPEDDGLVHSLSPLR